MRDLTTYDIDAELLPARELMGCAPRHGQSSYGHSSSSYSYTSVYNQGSGDGNGNVGLLNIGNGSFDGNNVYISA